MAALRAVLFDAGDTLVYFGGSKIDRLAWVCQLAGLPVPEPGARLRAARAVEAFFQGRYQTLAYGTPEFWHTLNRIAVSAMGLAGDLDDMAARFGQAAVSAPRRFVADPDAPALLDDLRRAGYRLGVVSNWDPYLADVLREVGLLDYFGFVGASDAVGMEKPDPAFFRLVLRELGVAPAEALHVGDSPAADVGGALAAGVRPLLFDALDLFEGGFPGLPPFPRIRRLAEVRAHLG